ncbi:tetratricopeptide repeat protein [Cerasicoccus maritimus]|uniref:tetratricopeptide repeat protein n=1 Tax=Cerasicoccus maritimus TaxID=490089 RepID=UPI0028528E56|nr:tetratricopeptide repeat protein [Cerasicoccus maritimus]
MHLVRIVQLLQMGRSKEAEEIARDWVVNEPNNPETFYWLARCLLNQNRGKEAMPTIDAALALESMDARFHNIRAEALYVTGKHRAALKALETAIELDPDDEDNLILMGYIQLKLSQRPKALESVNRALALNPQSTRALQLRAAILARMNKKDAAAADMQQVLAADADDDGAHLTQGWNCLLGGSYQQASIHFAEALRIDPTNEGARQGLLQTFKARSFVYRILFGFLLWYAKLPTMGQIAFLGGFIFFGDEIPLLLGKLTNSSTVYILADFSITVFLILLLAKDAIFNLVIYCDASTRIALSDLEKRGVFWSSWFLVGIAGFAVARLLTGDYLFVTHSLAAALAAGIVSDIYELQFAQSRRKAWISVLAVCALSAFFTVGYYLGMPEARTFVSMSFLAMILVAFRINHLRDQE